MTNTSSGAAGGSQSSHSHSEVGHIKNVANFNVLINTCQGFGTSYNPTNSNITVTAMQALYNTADAVVTNSTNLANTMQQAINTRINTFTNVKPIATRIMAALIAGGADEQTIKNAQTINRKIQGRRAAPVSNTNPVTPTGTTPSTNPTTGGTSTTPAPVSQRPIGPPVTVQPVVISVSQQSFDR